MKKLIITLFVCFVAICLHAQTTLKATKAISRSDWNTYLEEFFSYGYGTASVLNNQDIAERLVGDKPANPQDKVNWRPPPIPPTDNPDNPTGVKPVKVKGGKISSIRPKPIDPGCPVCSVFIFPKEVSIEVINKVKNVLESYR